LFKGLGGLANIGSVIKQAQQMSGRLKTLNNELRTKRATGSAGGGLIEVDVNGLSEVLAVRIDPTLIEKGDKEMIEDLLPTAVNAAQRKAKELHAEAMQSMTSDLNLPGLGEALQQLGVDGPDGE
jgi:DNA-binding YbaB/EbfC family protein